MTILHKSRAGEQHLPAMSSDPGHAAEEEQQPCLRPSAQRGDGPRQNQRSQRLERHQRGRQLQRRVHRRPCSESHAAGPGDVADATAQGGPLHESLQQEQGAYPQEDDADEVPVKSDAQTRTTFFLPEPSAACHEQVASMDNDDDNDEATGEGKGEMEEAVVVVGREKKITMQNQRVR